ncbi:MAG: hypothetical protein EOO25_10575 [Comamonadaceae bacterium]|nr:MAG: hypothetical protein EOO25_10575 [Comamonadaceae bacterium]
MVKTSSKSAQPASPRQPFTFYAAQGRVYVSNNAQKLIDLGSLTESDQRFAYLLDGNQQSADGFPSAQAALRHVADHVRFLFLDGQFTAVEDARGSVDLKDAASIEVLLDELKSGERVQDASV